MWKSTFIVLAWVFSVILHNIINGLFAVKEWVFFIIAVIIIPAYVFASLIYTGYRMAKKKMKNRGRRKESSPEAKDD